MLEFANRLTSREIEDFITSNGFCVHELTYSKNNRKMMQGTFRVSLHYFDFWFDDTSFVLKAIRYKTSVIKKFEETEADISAEDWRCFMKMRFGQEYINRYFNKTNMFYNSDEVTADEFVKQITIQDIFTLLEDEVAAVSCIKEFESFNPNRRRFKFYTGNATREVAFASFYDNSTIKNYITEEKFLSFMYEKFGNDFAKYYLSLIDDIEKCIIDSLDEPQNISRCICVYRENMDSLECKKYLAERIFSNC